MSVIVSIEEAGAGRKQVKVAVPAPAVEAETSRVSQEYRKQAKLPGFRKGKVPAALLQQRFGEDIEREVVERLVPRYWKQAEAEARFEPLLTPELGDVDHQPGEDLTFVAVVDLAPDFELRNVTDFDLPDPPVEPSKEDVETALEELRRGVAEWVETDRPAAQGDLVKARIDPQGDEAGSEEDSEEDSEDGAEPFAFEVGHAQVWEELSLSVTGKKKGQKAEFERTEPVPAAGDAGDAEDVPAETVKKTYRVDIVEVSERDLPALDDEFAAKVGEFDSLDNLTGDIRQRLKSSNELERRRERERALFDQLVERHPIEVSERVVYKEIEGMLTDYATNLSRQGVDVENAGMDWQKLGDQLKPQAERRVRSRLILDKIGESGDFGLADEELEAAIGALARREGQSSQSVRQALDRSGRLGPLRDQLLRDKIVRRLIGEEEPEPEAADSEEEE